MTANEERLTDAIDLLYYTYSDEMSETEIEGFNYNIEVLLDRYGVSLERYHEILLEKTENIVQQGD